MDQGIDMTVIILSSKSRRSCSVGFRPASCRLPPINPYGQPVQNKSLEPTVEYLHLKYLLFALPKIPPPPHTHTHLLPVAGALLHANSRRFIR